MHKSSLFRKITFLFTLYLTLPLACTILVTDDKLIFGQWTGIEWLANGAPAGYDPQDATFTFNEGGDYTFQYDDNIEKGRFTLSNNELFTTPEGGLRMMVKVIKLTNDTLVFDMNRGGQPETLILVRK